MSHSATCPSEWELAEATWSKFPSRADFARLRRLDTRARFENATAESSVWRSHTGRMSFALRRLA